MAYQGRRQQSQNGTNRNYGPIKGKGILFFLNQDTLSFVQAAINDVAKCYTDELHENDPDSVIRSLLDLSRSRNEDDLIWKAEDDDFGTKAFCTTPYAIGGADLEDSKGELRFTVVRVKRTGDLNVDVRLWGPYTWGK